MRMKSFYVFVLLWLNVGALQPQNKLIFNKMSLDQGLSQASVVSICEDSDGFIWFGTSDGLNKFDGYRMTVYRFNSADESSLSNSNILSLLKDRSNEFWIGTRGGLNRFIRETNSFEHFIDQSDEKNVLSNNIILAMSNDSKNSDVLWLGTPRGLKKFDKRARSFNNYKIDDSSSTLTDNIISICSSNGKLWLGAGSGLYQFDPISEKFEKIRINLKGIDRNIGITLVYTDRKNNVWIGTVSSGLICIDPNGNYHQYQHDISNPASLSDTKITSILEDHGGYIWIGTYGSGINKLDVVSGKSIHSAWNPNWVNSLSSNEVRCIYEDKSENLWFGTWGGGVCQLSRVQENFKLYENENDINNALTGSIYSIYEDHIGDLWCGTSNTGVHRVENQTGKLTTYKHQPDKNGSIGGNFVISVYEDRENNVWIGSTTGGLSKFIRKNQTFENYKNNPQDSFSLGYDNVQALLEDKDGRFWVGTFGGGLDEFDKKSGQFRHFRHDEKNEFSLSSDVVQYLFEDRNGYLWIATGGGLNRFDKKSGQFFVFKSNQNSSSNDYIYCIYEDPDSGLLWLGTGGGLAVFDKANKEFRYFDEKKGLPNNTVYGILQDGHGNLWLSTNKGLAKFNIFSETFKNYDKEDGLQSNEFNQGAFFRNRQGEMFFGGIKGVNYFHPDSMMDNPHKPPVVLTSFRKFDQETAISVNAVKELELGYRDYAFSFEYSALDFTNPMKNKYAYKMEGFDEHWIFTGADRRFAVYTNLDPGEYVFRVRGSNNDGLWNEEGASIRIHIEAPYWKTWWFRLLIMSVIGIMATLLYNYRVRQLLYVERLRSEIASDLHDDIGSTLTSISHCAELIRSGTAGRDQANMLEHIEEMAREVMTSMSDIVWSIDARHDRYSDLIDRMRDFAFKVLSIKSITLSINDHGIKKEHLSPDLRQNMYMIFKEAIHNVIKHAEATAVEVDLEQTNGHLEMTIRDNGKGIESTLHRIGHGLKSMHHRAERIKGTLEIHNDRGTVITLKIPLRYKTKG